MSSAQPSSKIIVDALWKQAQSTVRLPRSLDLHDAHQELLSNVHAPLRTFDRYDWQTRCILLHEETLYGIVTRDISRTGVGFFSPVEMRPGQLAEIILPGLRLLSIKSLHTTRLESDCFECGACFKGNPARSNDLLDSKS